MTTYSDWVNLTGRTLPSPLENEPQEFKIETATATSLKLSWMPSEIGDESSYQLQKEVDAEWVDLAIVAPLFYTDEGLEPDTLYNYRLRAVFQ